MDEVQMPGRRRPWRELNDSEKIERLREVIRSREREINNSRIRFVKFEGHDHKDGIALAERAIPQDPQDIYF